MTRERAGPVLYRQLQVSCGASSTTRFIIIAFTVSRQPRQCPFFGCYQITSRGSDLHPPAAPPAESYALSREERAGTHRIARLLIERTIPAICIGLRRFCNVIAPSRGRITRIQCRQVGMSSATDKEACDRNERARNQAALHQRTPCNHSIHVHGPLGNNIPDPVQSTEPDQ